MATRSSDVISSTICVAFPPESYPETLSKATAYFSHIGDIARMDMTTGKISGLVVITFFDIRCAQVAVAEFKDSAMYCPPAEHDFRAVKIPLLAMGSLPATSTDFSTYGSIDNVSVLGDDMVVSFYDMRAAQKVCLFVPGFSPHHTDCADPALPQPPSADGQLHPSATAVAPVVAAAESPVQLLIQGISETVARLESQMAATCDGSTTASSTSDRSRAGSERSGFAKLLPRPPGDVAAADKTASTQQRGARTGKPICEKVSTKELSKFDIVPERIRSGEDTRTTVMVRNIPKSVSQENFADLMGRAGLSDSYVFFYMPFDKRRNVHCGYGFVNFKTPANVLTLYKRIQGFAAEWNGKQPQPAVSYARLQGQEQLLKHFCLSAVLHDGDSRKRPQFLQPCPHTADAPAARGGHETTSEGGGLTGAVAGDPAMEPHYVVSSATAEARAWMSVSTLPCAGARGAPVRLGRTGAPGQSLEALEGVRDVQQGGGAVGRRFISGEGGVRGGVGPRRSSAGMT